MNRLGLIAGSAYRDLLKEEDTEAVRVSTSCGEASLWLTSSMAFLPRHGMENDIPPHRINHQANMLAFKQLGVSRILGVNSTGSLRKTLPPTSLLVPHDYINLWGIKTVYDNEIRHVTPGLDPDLRGLILGAATRAGIPVVAGGVYIQTSGPRLETRAEIGMLKFFGDVVGMTMGNEATLAKELDLAYASICSVDNFCHGITSTPLREDEILGNARKNVESVKRLIRAVLEELG
ncbi:MAG: MTAP family purine nucleoside phosphorylase [Deltaproteobacteria bacterium]|nr:MTAP family purine nucleoside phosphorylase [Deltaproteobacteria bacterium]